MLQRFRNSLSKRLERYPAIKRTASSLGKRKKIVLTCFVLIAHLVGALTSLRAIMEVRTAQGTIAWVFALNTVPYVSVPAYWIFGRSKFEGYAVARQKDRAQTDPIARQYLADLANRYMLASPVDGHSLLVEKLALMRFTTGNDAELLVDGEATFKSVFEGIDRAEDYILVEFYIVRDDKLGGELKRRLIDKARKGVRVCLLYDPIGSAGLPR